jgi:fused signal recognition particle receptor
MGVLGFFTKENKESLNKGLEKTKESLLKKISKAVAGKSRVDDEVLDNLEEVLISSDVGVETTLRIIERIQKRAAEEKYLNTAELNQLLKSEIANLLAENKSIESELIPEKNAGNPYVIMVVGVNGVGKTTTIGKLAHLYNDRRSRYF